MRRSVWRALTGIGLVVAACGGKAEDQSASHDADYQEPSPFFHSGSRLKAHVLRAPKAPPVLIEIIDSESGEPCAFRRANDDELRCLPRPTASPVVYADDGCTEPLLVSVSTGSPPNCSQLRRASLGATQCRTGQFTVVEIEPSEAPTGDVYQRHEACELASLKGGDVYTLVREIDATEYVKADLEERVVSDGLIERVLVAEDGSEWPYDLFASPQGVSCEPCTEEGYGALSLLSNEEPIYCGPDAFVSSVSLDSSCTDTEGVATAISDACLAVGDGPPKYARGQDAWWEISPEPLRPVYGTGSGACTEVDYLTFFGTEAKSAASSWPSLERARVGSGAVQANGFAHEGSLVKVDQGAWGAFFDAARGQPCDAIETPVGIACIPGFYGDVSTHGVYYADAEQRQQLFALPRASDGSNDELRRTVFPVRLPVVSGYECIPLIRIETIYSLGERHTGPVYGTSGAQADEQDTELYDFYVLSEALPWNDFVRLREATE